MVMQKKTRLYCDHDSIILCFYCVLLVNGLFFFFPLSTDIITSQRKVEEQSLQVSTLVVVHGECCYSIYLLMYVQEY